jgi:hypothetical protein
VFLSASLSLPIAFQANLLREVETKVISVRSCAALSLHTCTPAVLYVEAFSVMRQVCAQPWAWGAWAEHGPLGTGIGTGTGTGATFLGGMRSHLHLHLDLDPAVWVWVDWSVSSPVVVFAHACWASFIVSRLRSLEDRQHRRQAATLAASAAVRAAARERGEGGGREMRMDQHAVFAWKGASMAD